jgi:hypothetical protein
VLGPPNGTISGIVLDQLDQPVTGATVYVDGVPVAVSGPDGAFTTDVVTGGSRSLSASAPRHVRRVVRSTSSSTATSAASSR